MVYWKFIGDITEFMDVFMSMGWFSREILGNSHEFHGKISQNRCPWLDFPDTNPLGTCLHSTTRWCPQTIAKLVQITPITRVYRWYIELANTIINQLITWGAPPCSESVMKDPRKDSFEWIGCWRSTKQKMVTERWFMKKMC